MKKGEKEQTISSSKKMPLHLSFERRKKLKKKGNAEDGQATTLTEKKEKKTTPSLS